MADPVYHDEWQHVEFVPREVRADTGGVGWHLWFSLWALFISLLALLVSVFGR